MNKAHALRIGITIGLQAPNETLWNNGIKQNALFLAKLFQQSPLGHDVVLLNITDIEITNQLPWDLAVFPTLPFDTACNGLDVVIELGGQVGFEQTCRLKAQGTKLVSYCCGPEYVQNIEAMIFGRHLWDAAFINDAYDEIWIIPQVWELNRGFLQTFRKRPIRLVPFVWDPMMLESVTKDHPHQGLYQPSCEPKRLTVIEPNIDVLKFCLYPILIAERAFWHHPEKISFLHVANASHLAQAEREFSGLMRKLDIVKAGKASFIGRVNTPEFLSTHTDIVISHQWGLPLNYFYLECCWQGYPLIHNAEIIPDLGYYYPAHDLEIGAEQLTSAILNHDSSWEDYRQQQRHAIQPFLATDKHLSEQYDTLLYNLTTQENYT